MKKIKFKFALLGILLASAFFSHAQQADANQKLYPFEGTYDFGNNEKITLGIFDEFGGKLVYLNLKTLKQGALLPIDATHFKEINDSTLVFTFKDKTLIQTKNGKSIVGKKIKEHTRETLSFRSGSNTMEGDLYLPETTGKHPVVVFAHGSGPVSRRVSFFTTYFLQLGIGVFTYDKQGVGKSTGDWETASLDELAADVVAAVAIIKKHPKVNTSKIGIMGTSQGGWVGTMAASKSKDVSFLLMRVGSGQSVLETIAHEYEGSFIADGFTKEEIAEIMVMVREHWGASNQNKTWEDGNNIYLKYKEKPWFSKVFPKPRVKTPGSEKWWTWLSKNLYVDSYDYLKQLKMPVFWQLAEKDWNVNSQKSYPRIKEALTVAGNKDHTVFILPDMGHGGTVTKTGLPNDEFSWQYAPGYWDAMSRWLKDRKIAQ